MRLLLDEVFGAENFVSEVTWEKTHSPRNDAKGLSSRTDTILLYCKSSTFTPNRLARTAEMNARYSNPDNDPKGLWKTSDSSAPGAKTHQGMVYAIEHPLNGQLCYPTVGRCWSIGQEELLEIMREWSPQYVLKDINDEDERARRCEVSTTEVRKGVPAIVVSDNKLSSQSHAREVYERGQWPQFWVVDNQIGRIRRKSYLCDVADRTPENLWTHAETGHNDAAKKEIRALFPNISVFSTPKPERLLERVVHIGSDPGDLVLDVFAGSGTTAAVAQKMGRRWVTCELIEDTFTTFTKARLVKVVNDEDPGGISRAKGERVAAEGVELPDGVTVEDAAKFTSVLNKLISDDSEAKKAPIVKALKAASKTVRTKETINWRGGGGFQVAHLSPACFDYDPELDRVVLTPAARGEMLVESVAANLGFELLHPDDDYVFDGRRGNCLLKVVEGIADQGLVDNLVSHIEPGETIVVAATVVMDGVRQYLRKACKGSQVVTIPDGIFNYTKGGEQS